MAQIRMMREAEAERVRDLWMQMSAEMGTPLPETSAQRDSSQPQAVSCSSERFIAWWRKSKRVSSAFLLAG